MKVSQWPNKDYPLIIYILYLMRPFFLLVACVLWATALSAQVQWLNPSNRWTFHGNYALAGTGMETFQTGGEIYLSGKIYRRVIRHYFINGNTGSDERYLRQEGRKLYARRRGIEDEFLMYDFSLAIGDTVYIPYSNDVNFGYVITATSMVSVGSSQRAAQTVKWINKPNTAKAIKSVFIEGIGSIEGTHIIGGEECLTESYLFLDEPSSEVVDGPERIFCNFSSPEGAFLGLGNAFCTVLPTSAPLEQHLQVRPTLSTGQVQITHDAPEEELMVQLYDLSGRLIQQQSMRGSGSLETSYKGVGVLQISTDQEKMAQKVVFY